MIHRFRRCGHDPGALTPEDQAVVDQFRAMLAAVRAPEPWTPGRSQDIAVRVDPFIERAHTGRRRPRHRDRRGPGPPRHPARRGLPPRPPTRLRRLVITETTTQ
ncbi:hypothetical protein [Streptomyces olivaceoviridis]|uniref:hypothetical protein n=1 Tax=Streptomyces olivaceoviridis TaxID=1921 RepID=UPI0033FE7D0E